MTEVDVEYKEMSFEENAGNNLGSDAFNVVLKDPNFSYNTCDRQGKIFAQIISETNGLGATIEAEGVEWSFFGRVQLLDYFKRTAKAKVRWFNQEFWEEGTYKDFVQIAYYEQIEEGEEIDEEKRFSPTDTTDYYGVYNENIQSQYLVSIPKGFKKDTLGQFKAYTKPSALGKIQIEKNIYNYAYGGILGNVSHLTTDDGFNYRGRGGIQVTGKGNYQTLNTNLKKAPYNYTQDIVENPDLVATDAKLVIYSAFIHFKKQLKNNIQSLDEYSIHQISALVNTGKITGSPNHPTTRLNNYCKIKKNYLKCENEEFTKDDECKNK